MLENTPEATQQKHAPAILVVEDEFLIRMMVAETLADAGFRTSEAATAKQALLALEKEEVGAVILDVGLPDASGEDLIAKIRTLKPGMPIIMTTGYDTHDLRKKSEADPALRILTKPYQLELLGQILNEWGLGA